MLLRYLLVHLMISTYLTYRDLLVLQYMFMVCVYCTLIEFFVCFVEKNTQIITEERGLQDILIALDNHRQCKDLSEAACSALWSLSMEGNC